MLRDREDEIERHYLALVAGSWNEDTAVIHTPLLRLADRMVADPTGQRAETRVWVQQRVGKRATILDVQLMTGRKHQIRVHLQSEGHPIAGDDRYGFAKFNSRVEQLGGRGLFLHATKLVIPQARRPGTGRRGPHAAALEAAAEGRALAQSTLARRDMMAEGQWKQVAQRVFQRRYDPLDITVGAVLGEHGLTVIDTRNNACEAQEIIDDVSARFDLPIVAVINTHAHYDHTFGNQLFAQHSIPIYGHHLIPSHFEEYEKPRLEKVQRSPEAEPEMDWDGVVLTPPTHLLAQPCTLNLGGREVELIPLDAGHTDTELAIHIPDANTWFLGDIIEQSGPPMFGSGAYPLDWPIVLESLLERIQPGDIIVPGHGWSGGPGLHSATIATASSCWPPPCATRINGTRASRRNLIQCGSFKPVAGGFPATSCR